MKKQDTRDWSNEPLTALQTFILETHHAYTRDALDAVMHLAGEVANERVRGLVRRLCGDLLPHMMKEEQILFPYVEELESGEDGADPFFGTIVNPIRMMMQEHDAAADLLVALRTVTDGYALPDDAAGSLRSLYERLAALEEDLFRHIDLENNVLFPRAAALEATVRNGIVRTY